ncbi:MULTISPECIES: hypothetical protein [unclassified Pseudoalteromonas]|uniref:hypothetical protein n=1 Tax=unclassified Pseudoalteromonas TaxID=194690 RepID=UPI0007314FA8|nr:MULTISPECIES: hypothetical protein [unclassified Pseudoalteromonas]KTD90264.1 hypothetical protein ATS71_07080 [Pseudoalteromonas sp. H71]MBW4965590.1 hypothetical protein [Pseudoalteromonas sp. CR1]TMN83012.1 hypothetical protein CWB64_10070 [Pseudoalteromonas sp. S410]TMN90175.1 hypothetical protein CWB62_09935 [Pseudoalteromonas sp. S408]TMN99284.1 hypothetical protein CWB63_09820 [Pseudoalteromonas sp. S409]
MGLILGPVLVVWLAIFIYSTRLGYLLIHKNMALEVTLITLTVALVGAIAFVFYGYKQFINETSLWAFEIPSYFVFNKFAIFSVGLALCIKFFITSSQNSVGLACVVFVILFVFSASVLLSVGLHDRFISYNNIQLTH